VYASEFETPTALVTVTAAEPAVPAGMDAVISESLFTT
jgi:hypothetical protein